MNFGLAVVAIAVSEPSHLEVPVLQMGGRLGVSGCGCGKAPEGPKAGGGFRSSRVYGGSKAAIEGKPVA
jgi:hypothetical protein